MITRTLLPHAQAFIAGRRLASTKPNSSRRRLVPRSQALPAADPDVAIHAATKQTIRRIVLTGAVALITIVGAITGARLKSDRDEDKQRQEVLELPLDDRIAMLEERRSGLVGLKMPLERKLVGLRERMEAEKKKKIDEAEGQA